MIEELKDRLVFEDLDARLLTGILRLGEDEQYRLVDLIDLGVPLAEKTLRLAEHTVDRLYIKEDEKRQYKHYIVDEEIGDYSEINAEEFLGNAYADFSRAITSITFGAASTVGITPYPQIIGGTYGYNIIDKDDVSKQISKQMKNRFGDIKY